MDKVTNNAMPRTTMILVEADVEFKFPHNEHTVVARISNILAVWDWDSTDRSTAELSAVRDYVQGNFTYDNMVIINYCGSPIATRKEVTF